MKKEYRYAIKTAKLFPEVKNSKMYFARVRVWEARENETIELHPAELGDTHAENEEEAEAEMRTKVEKWIENRK